MQFLLVLSYTQTPLDTHRTEYTPRSVYRNLQTKHQVVIVHMGSLPHTNTHTHDTHTHTCHTHTHTLHTQTQTHTHSVFVCVCVCVSVSHTHTRRHVVHTQTHTHTRRHTHTHTHTETHTHKHTHTDTHRHTDTHKHTSFCSLSHHLFTCSLTHSLQADKTSLRIHSEVSSISLAATTPLKVYSVSSSTTSGGQCVATSTNKQRLTHLVVS